MPSAQRLLLQEILLEQRMFCGAREQWWMLCTTFTEDCEVLEQIAHALAQESSPQLSDSYPKCENISVDTHSGAAFGQRRTEL